MYILAIVVCALMFAGVIAYVAYDALEMYREIRSEEERLR